MSKKGRSSVILLTGGERSHSPPLGSLLHSAGMGSNSTWFTYMPSRPYKPRAQTVITSWLHYRGKWRSFSHVANTSISDKSNSDGETYLLLLIRLRHPHRLPVDNVLMRCTFIVIFHTSYFTIYAYYSFTVLVFSYPSSWQIATESFLAQAAYDNFAIVFISRQ